ncbi:MAG: hypothetical protein ACI4XM_07870 [Candidatus Coprovivens sp.]
MKKIHESKNNKKFNATVDKVHEEMESVKELIGDWSLRWEEKYFDVYCYDLQFLLEDDIDLLESKYDGTYDLSRCYDDSKREGQALERVVLEDYCGEEYNCEFRGVKWELYNSRLFRKFIFYSNGDVVYSQHKRKRTSSDQSYDYSANYNINHNNLYLILKNALDKFSLVIDGEKRGLFVNGIVISENESNIEITESKNDVSSYTINLNSYGQVESRVYVTNDDTYIFSNGELIDAYRIVGQDKVELNISEESLETLKQKIANFAFGLVDDYSVLDELSKLKYKLINAIKSIKGDVVADGLLRRIDIALSMINTNKKSILADTKELKKK